MGKNNRKRRAEKARKRGRRSSGPLTANDAAGSTRLSDTELIDFAAASYWSGRDDAVTVAATRLAERPPKRVAFCLAVSLETEVAAAWERGWQPAELVGLVNKHLKSDEVDVACAAIAGQATSYLQWGAAVSPRWMAQLETIDASPGQSTTADVLLGRCADWPATVIVALRLVGLLRTAPRVPTLTPPPSQWSAACPRGEQAHRLPPEVLSRIRALLAKAESTTFDAEAESFTAKAQELMTRHRIDRASVDPATDEATVAVRVVVESPYADAKAALLGGIASANGCRAVWTRDLGFSTLFGHPDDLEGVEELFTSLLVQATAALRREGPRRDRSGRSRTRRFRQSFLAGFAQRVSERLSETTADTVHRAETETGRALLPVLRAREAAAEQAMRDTYEDLGSFDLSVSDREGRLRGAVFADAVDLALSPGEIRLSPVPERTLGSGSSP